MNNQSLALTQYTDFGVLSIICTLKRSPELSPHRSPDAGLTSHHGNARRHRWDGPCR